MKDASHEGTPPTRSPVQLTSAVPQFTVADVVGTAAYYRDVLGFTIEGFWDGDAVHSDPARPAWFGIVHRDQVRFHFNGNETHPSGRP